jgi:hypothetical protein
MRDNHFDPRTELVIAGIDTTDGPEHPCFDGDSKAEPVDEGMVRFMTNYGWFGSVVVTTIGTRRYVLAGRRRIRAAREACVRLEAAGGTPFRVAVEHHRPDVKNRDAGLLAIVFAENALRRKERSPVALARQAARMANAGSKIDETALAMGVTENGVRRYLKINELAPVVKAAVEAEQITVDAGLLLHGKEEPAQAEGLAKMLAPQKQNQPEPVVPSVSRALVPAKKRQRRAAGDRPKRVGKSAAEAALSGAPVPANGGGKRNAKTVRKIVALPIFVASEEFKRGALWAIGDMTDEETGVFLKGGPS